jgi:Uma2 family endonuclease
MPKEFKASRNSTCAFSPTRYLVPDVIADSKLQHPYPTEPVLLCVEVLSAENHIGAMLAKCEQYHAWGVPFC